MKKKLTGSLIFFGILAAFLYRPSLPLEKLTTKYTDQYSDFVEIDEMNVHYRKSGSGAPVLLIHGTSASLHTWQEWQRQLSEHFTVYSMDLPGCGLTGPHPQGDYSIQAYLDFLDAFTDKLGLESFYVAGNSLGGHIVWEYAAISSKVKKAVLVDPSGFYLADRDIPLVFRLGKKKIFASIVEGLNVKPLVSKSLKKVYYDKQLVSPELKQRYFDMIRREGNRNAFIKKVSILEVSKVEELHAIDIPVLIQWGRQDEWIPLELADIFTENLSDNQLIIYDECGHVPQEEIPEISVRDAIEFLKKLPNVETDTSTISMQYEP